MHHRAINKYILFSFLSILFLFLLVIGINSYTLKLLHTAQHKKDHLTQTLISSYQAQLESEKLLTTFNFSHDVKNWKSSLQTYKKNFLELSHHNDIQFSQNFYNYQKNSNLLFEQISAIVDSDFFDNSYKQDKPLFEKYNETKQNQDMEEFIPVVKELIGKIESLRDNQQLIIDELMKINTKNTQLINEQMERFDQNNNFFTLVIFFLLVVLVIKTFSRLQYFTENLNISKNFLENVINSIPIRIFWKDTKGRYLGANKLFLQDLGLDSKDQLLNKTDFDLTWDKKEATQMINYDQKIISTKKPIINSEEKLTVHTQKEMIINLSKVPFYKDDQIIGLIGIYEDITKKIEDKNNLRKQELMILHQNRLVQMGEMISMIAHQWRQPLNTISLQIVSIEQKINKNNTIEIETLQKKCENISKNIHYLSHTIEDFRDFFKPNKETTITNAGEIIRETIAMIEPTLKSHGISLIQNNLCGKDKPLYKNEIKQVLINIIKNSIDAIEARDIKEPKIFIQSHCDSTQKSLCNIIIKDNAGGIPDDIIDDIFDPYFSTKQEKNGTGLGLYMSKIIITEHCKGSISCSNEDNGVLFKIQI